MTMGTQSLMNCGVWKVLGILSLDGLWGLTPLKKPKPLNFPLESLDFNCGWMDGQVRHGGTPRQISLQRLVCLGSQDPNLAVHLPMDVS